MFLDDRDPTPEDLMASIRQGTLSNTFTPVFVGSALKNTGIQTLLDGVLNYMPSPTEVGCCSHPPIRIRQRNRETWSREKQKRKPPEKEKKGKRENVCERKRKRNKEGEMQRDGQREAQGS